MIRIDKLNKYYGGRGASQVHAVNDVSITLPDSGMVAIFGKSGCGKTTLLNMVGGLDKASSGEVLIDGKRITPDSDSARNLKVGYIFQNYNLSERMSVYDNVAVSLRLCGMTDEAEIEARVLAALRSVDMEKYRKRLPTALSGGQQQRVAIARALAVEPRVLLLDEPLGALDLKLRKDMQVELKNIQQRLGITFIYVTHDQEEALSMSDTIVVMDSGVIQQIGTPTDIYNEPKNAFVADFIGESNIIEGVMRADFWVEMAGHKFKCLDKGFGVDEEVDVVVRPEDVDVVPVEDAMISGVVTSTTFKGDYYEIIVEIKGFKWMIESTHNQTVGSTIGLNIIPDAIHIMKKSKYSGLYGDYSSFSEEFDELSDATYEEEDE